MERQQKRKKKTARESEGCGLRAWGRAAIGLLARWALIPCLPLLLGGPPARAQTNLETNAGIQFNFSTPGAGNLALGGAFLALANDATTAYTNPAGLTNLSASELTLELRSWSYTHVFTDRGRDPRFSPTHQGIDTIEGLRDGAAQDRVTGVSFLSYVYPRDRWAVAVYRHELASFEANFSAQGAFLERTRSRLPIGFPILTNARLASLKNQMALDIVNYGVSASYRIGRGGAPDEGFSIGLGLSYYDFSIDSKTERFLPDLFAESDFQERRTDIQTQIGEDSAWGVTLGFFWKTKGAWSIGGVYRQGPEFDFAAASESTENSFLDFSVAQRARFHVPDVYGLGVAFEPTDTIRITFDYDRIEYSDLLGNFLDIFNVIEILGLDPELENFVIDDADELHLGFEYWLKKAGSFFIRLGAWYDPDHTLRFEGDSIGLQAVYRARNDEMHYSAGVGISQRRFQIDAAFDYSERVKTISASTAYRF